MTGRCIGRARETERERERDRDRERDELEQQWEVQIANVMDVHRDSDLNVGILHVKTRALNI